MRHEGRTVREDVTPITRPAWPHLVAKRRAEKLAELRSSFGHKSTWTERVEDAQYA